METLPAAHGSSYGALNAHSDVSPDAHHTVDEAIYALAKSEREKEGHAADILKEERRTACVSRSMGLAGVMVILGAVGYMKPGLIGRAQGAFDNMVRTHCTVNVEFIPLTKTHPPAYRKPISIERVVHDSGELFAIVCMFK